MLEFSGWTSTDDDIEQGCPCHELNATVYVEKGVEHPAGFAETPCVAGLIVGGFFSEIPCYVSRCCWEGVVWFWVDVSGYTLTGDTVKDLNGDVVDLSQFENPLYAVALVYWKDSEDIYHFTQHYFVKDLGPDEDRPFDCMSWDGLELEYLGTVTGIGIDHRMCMPTAPLPTVRVTSL